MHILLAVIKRLGTLAAISLLSGCLPVWHGTFSNTLDIPATVTVFAYPSNTVFSKVEVPPHSTGRCQITFGRAAVSSAAGEDLGDLTLAFTAKDRTDYAKGGFELFFLISKEGLSRVLPEAAED
ncbi:MAG: hypothetical protein H0X34_11895 [Chthoniobacterales bacterium]|nr:hypothetical protein [Chthoniobacterales bacterium]